MSEMEVELFCFAITQGADVKIFWLWIFTVSCYELITAGFFPMNLKHVQCFGKGVICFNFIDWAKNR